MVPQYRAISTCVPCQRSFFPWLSMKYPTTDAMRMAKMNMKPPMVGVPCLFLCQLGPMSRMVCPKCSLCR